MASGQPRTGWRVGCAVVVEVEGSAGEDAVVLGWKWSPLTERR